MAILRVLLSAAAGMVLSSGLALSVRAQTTPLRERRLAPAEVGKKIRLLVPYCKLPLGNQDECPITKIIVGPSLHPKAAENSLRRFLDSIGLANVAIDVSPIPLRV